ncbi:MAG: sorbosone dehydrogenase family protein [Phycisphaerales bacterium]
MGMIRAHQAVVATLGITALVRAQPGDRGGTANSFDVRPGFKITLAADNIRGARFLEFDDAGTLYLSIPTSGTILSLKDANADGVYQPEERQDFVTGYESVHGLCWQDGWLWFAQTGAIHRARDTNADGKADETETIIPQGRLPSGGGHWWRSLLVTDAFIYTSIGDSGNITDERNSERQKIFRFRKDGSAKVEFASGIRNTEKLRLRPGTNEVWGVDHGSDWFGREYGEGRRGQPITDRNPPDEFNLYLEGHFYGHPFITGNRVPRLEFRGKEDLVGLAEQTTPPEWLFGAHWAANGWTFVTTDAVGASGDAFVATHGSWNSSVRVGYSVERVLFDPVTGKPFGMQRIVSCLPPGGGRPLARPVDCAEAPDGTVLFSCDSTGRIYRISRAE